MTLTLTIPDDILARATKLAETIEQPVEAILMAHLQTLTASIQLLPEEQVAELEALHHLSDDALWTIAREQMPSEIQNRAHDLMTRNNLEELDSIESDELQHYVDRADRLMLRKAEAAFLLRERGYDFKQEDFASSHE